MTRAQIQEVALSLPEAERAALAEVLTDSLHAEVYELPEEEKIVLRDRLASALREPGKGQSWEEVEAELWPEA